MKKNIVLLTAFWMLLSCGGREARNPADNEIYFNYNDCVEDFDFGDITDTIIQIVPLETTDDALIVEINKIEIRNNLIYILDNSVKSVFVYDFNGKYLNKINALGQGPGEYAFLSDMTVSDSAVIIIGNGTQMEYWIPSLKFWRKDKEDIFDKIHCDCSALFYMPHGLTYYINDRFLRIGAQSGHMLFSRKGNADSVNKHMPFTEEYLNWRISGYKYAIAGAQASIIYNGCDTVFRLNAQGEAYPEYTMIIEHDRALHDVVRLDERTVQTTTKDYRGRVFGMVSINESDKYLFIDVQVGQDYFLAPKKGNYGIYTCLYNKQNGNTVIYPQFANNSKFDNQKMVVRRVIDNKIIDWHDPAVMLADKENVFEKQIFANKSFEKQLKQTLAQLKNDDNPVLFIYSLK